MSDSYEVVIYRFDSKGNEQVREGCEVGRETLEYLANMNNFNRYDSTEVFHDMEGIRIASGDVLSPEPDFPYLGTVSHGTMRTGDLMETFADVLSDLVEQYEDPRRHSVLLYGQWGRTRSDGSELPRIVGAYEWIGAGWEYRWSDEGLELGSEIVNELFDALNVYAPEGYYFGAHPGDGSDYGYWRVEDDD